MMIETGFDIFKPRNTPFPLFKKREWNRLYHFYYYLKNIITYVKHFITRILFPSTKTEINISN